MTGDLTPWLGVLAVGSITMALLIGLFLKLGEWIWGFMS